LVSNFQSAGFVLMGFSLWGLLVVAGQARWPEGLRMNLRKQASTLNAGGHTP
jgi:hypothetical protein